MNTTGSTIQTAKRDSSQSYHETKTAETVGLSQADESSSVILPLWNEQRIDMSSKRRKRALHRHLRDGTRFRECSYDDVGAVHDFDTCSRGDDDDEDDGYNADENNDEIVENVNSNSPTYQFQKESRSTAVLSVILEEARLQQQRDSPSSTQPGPPVVPQQPQLPHDKGGVADPNNCSTSYNCRSLLDSSLQSHSYLYTMINPHSRQFHAQVFKGFISSVILVDVLIFILSTDQVTRQHFQPYHFMIIDGVGSSIFLVEYLARLKVAPEMKCFQRRQQQQQPSDDPLPAWKARVAWACTPWAIVDLAACLPFFLQTIYSSAFKQDSQTLISATTSALRVVRMARILKTEGAMRAMSAFCRVVYYNREILQVTVLIGIWMVVFTAGLLYFFRPRRAHHHYYGYGDEDDDDSFDKYHFYREKDFDSIFSTLALSIKLLTRQGKPAGGSDLPWYTQMVVLLTSIVSVPMIALPASLLTWGFGAEAARLARKNRRLSNAAAAGADENRMQQQQPGNCRNDNGCNKDNNNHSCDKKDNDLCSDNSKRFSSFHDEYHYGNESDEEYLNVISKESKRLDTKRTRGQQKEPHWQLQHLHPATNLQSVAPRTNDEGRGYCNLAPALTATSSVLHPSAITHTSVSVPVKSNATGKYAGQQDKVNVVDEDAVLLNTGDLQLMKKRVQAESKELDRILNHLLLLKANTTTISAAATTP